MYFGYVFWMLTSPKAMPKERVWEGICISELKVSVSSISSTMKYISVICLGKRPGNEAIYLVW